MNTAVLDAFLLKDATEHPARAKRAKNVLSQVMLHAIRHDLILSNPVRDVGRLPKSVLGDPRPATSEEVERLRWAASEFEAGNLRPGRRPTMPIGAIVDVMLCGLRLGEAIALRWDEVDLDARIPQITVSGTVIQLPKSFDGGPTARRQDKTKTPRSRRTIDVPDWIADRLRSLPRRGELIFCTASGSAYSPKNVARAWRAVCVAADVSGLVMHGLRKTAATVTSAWAGPQAAADLLGHVSDRLTKDRYIGRRESVTEARDALAVLFNAGR
ncbi:tyrosine-type recombinase/integrase [Cryobacterium lyxosi]|nr:site-specific integrase [Cryobacterium lyxosi]